MSRLSGLTSWNADWKGVKALVVCLKSVQPLAFWVGMPHTRALEIPGLPGQ